MGMFPVTLPIANHTDHNNLNRHSKQILISYLLRGYVIRKLYNIRHSISQDLEIGRPNFLFFEKQGVQKLNFCMCTIFVHV